MAKHARNPEDLNDDVQDQREARQGNRNANAGSDDPFAKTTSGFDNFAYSGEKDPALSGPISYDGARYARSNYGSHASYPTEDSYRGQGYAASDSAYPNQAGYGSQTYVAGAAGAAAGASYAGSHAQPSYGARDTYGFPANGGYAPASGSRSYEEDFWQAANQGKKKHPVLKKLLIALLVIVLLCVAAVAVYAHEFDSRVEANQSTPDQMADVLTPPTPGEPYYMLLLGSDWRENSGTSNRADQSGDNQRADVIILTRVDEAANQVTLVTVPRDTRWEHDGTVSKINEAYNIGGAALITQAVSELTGTPISYTAEIHFSGLMNMVDALGGVVVNVPQSIYFWDALTGEGIEVEAGEQRLNGQQAQVFARVRHDYTEQEGQRQSNVRTLVLAIANEIRGKSPVEWPFLCLDLANCFGSDLRFFDFARLLLNFMDDDITMYSATGPNKGDIDAGTGLWLCYANPDGWARLMEVVNAGEDPSSVDVNAGFEDQGTANTELLEGESVYTDQAADVQWDQAVSYDTWAAPAVEPAVEQFVEQPSEQQSFVETAEYVAPTDEGDDGWDEEWIEGGEPGESADEAFPADEYGEDTFDESADGYSDEDEDQ